MLAKRRRLPPQHAEPRCGVTLIEVLVVISIIGMLMSLLLPAVQAARGAILLAPFVGEPRAAGVDDARVAPTREANEFICGPRCVQHVLAHYGKREELIELVRELQGAAIDRPANLADMQAALRRRGVHAAAVKIAPGQVYCLDWAEPVIAHFKGDSRLGHFRVLYPDRATWTAACVWDGLAGESMRPAGALAKSASGVILLTSAAPIDKRPICLGRSWLAVTFGATVLVVPTITFFFAFARRTRRDARV